MRGILRGLFASPTLWRRSRQSHFASLLAGSLPMPSNSQREAATRRSHEFCGRPLAGLSLSEKTRYA
ncbi:hypothetical protein E2C01_097665 [Portunus trituberculatus]|uniref:Uncharacterized protein n=1 Tax=Portunus trituberculatus TaxID=210409 RepID=A0A5B7K6A2_PORTR|nr:hypothetical protein [Portunus trituberculatus]